MYLQNMTCKSFPFSQASDVNPVHFIAKAEEFADRVYKKTRIYLPFLARICFLSSFLCNAHVLIVSWIEHGTGVEEVGSFHDLMEIGTLVLFIFIELVGSAMIILQKKVALACGLLFFLPLFQIVLLIFIHSDFPALLRNISIGGGLTMLLAESQGEAQSLFAGVPTLENNISKNYLKLSGRCLLVFMFIIFIKMEASYLLILQDILGTMLMLFVVVGYKTKLSAFTLIVYLNIINYYENAWWKIPHDDEDYRAFAEYQFFQGLSITGGLLMVVLYGPGGISLDENKKKW